MLEIWFIRHGETDWNRTQRWQGQSDPPLNDEGRRQARALQPRLNGVRFDRIFTSDLGRCRDTAALALPECAVEPDRRLRELSFGTYEGKAWTELDEAQREGLSAFWHDPYAIRVGGGESFVDLARRVEAWMADLPREGRVAAFTHGGLIRCALWRVTGPPQRREWTVMLDNCSITRIGWRAERMVLMAVNDCAHLESHEGGFSHPITQGSLGDDREVVPEVSPEDRSMPQVERR